MIQASLTDFAGSIINCRIHDLLHGLAIQKAKDDNFLIACSKLDDLQNCSQIRRLVIHDSNYEREAELYGNVIAIQSPNLRSLFTGWLTPMVPQHLKVWSDAYSKIQGCDLMKVGRLGQLRYVELSIEVKSRKEIRNFQEFIGGMRFLETLDLRGSTITECDLPECLWHVKTLRHVTLPIESLVTGPPSSLNLINLQTLHGVKCRKSWAEDGLPKLANLKTFGIRTSNRSEWNAIASLLCTLEHLNILSLVVDGIPLSIIDMRDFPFYHCLQYLQFYGNGNKINLDHGMLPIHLTQLLLGHLEFQDDPMPVLEKLENLRWFWLENCKIHQLCCSAGGFNQLVVLNLKDLHELEEWNIKDGAMPMLKTLHISACPRLCVPPGLQHLAILQELTWLSGEHFSKISTTMENEIRRICNCVPAIRID